jgi:ABC-2 type transport system permease protein
MEIGSLTHVPLALGFMALAAVLFTALGTLLASVLADMQSFHLVMNLGMMPLFFLSNGLFPTKGLPRPLHAIARLNPVSYAVDAVRGALGASAFGLTLDTVVLATLTLLLVLVGARRFSRLEP